MMFEGLGQQFGVVEYFCPAVFVGSFRALVVRRDLQLVIVLRASIERF